MKQAAIFLAVSVVVFAVVAALVGYAKSPDQRAKACAHRLGIRWTHEDGATERLDAFQRCMA